MTAFDLTASLDAIPKALRRLDRRVLLESLNDGFAAGLVRSALAPADLPTSVELETLYGWKNGTSPVGVASIDDIHMFPGFYFLSLADALTNYQSFVGDPRWRTGWLPSFANGGEDFYVLDLGAPTANPVRYFRIEESEHPVEFSSVRAMMATLAAAFDRGVFFVDSNGYLEMDDLEFAGVAAEINPYIPWWHP